jgi:hypothetical protein
VLAGAAIAGTAVAATQAARAQADHDHLPGKQIEVVGGDAAALVNLPRWRAGVRLGAAQGGREEAMHEFAAAPTDVWVGSREAWQPWPPGAREILASGWFERVPEAQVPALQAELRAEAALYT